MLIVDKSKLGSLLNSILADKNAAERSEILYYASLYWHYSECEILPTLIEKIISDFDKFDINTQKKILRKIGYKFLHDEYSPEYMHKVAAIDKRTKKQINSIKISIFLASICAMGAIYAGLNKIEKGSLPTPFYRSKISRYALIKTTDDSYNYHNVEIEYVSIKPTEIARTITVVYELDQNNPNMGVGRKYYLDNINDQEFKNILSNIYNGYVSKLDEYDSNVVQVQIPEGLKIYGSPYTIYEESEYTGSKIIDMESRTENNVESVAGIVLLSTAVMIGFWASKNYKGNKMLTKAEIKKGLALDK